jgi:hypothetical protein
VLRQRFVIRFIQALEEGYNICNVDASSFDKLNYTRRSWQHKIGSNNVTCLTGYNRTSLHAAVTTKGQIFYQLHQSTNDTPVVILFMKGLMARLEEQDPDYKETTVFQFDNAPNQTSKLFKQWLSEQQLLVLWSGNYSFDFAAVEAIFALIKNGGTLINDPDTK